MTETAFNWKQPAGKALEMALNRALSLDAETQAALRGLDGQRVALQLTSPPLALQVRVEGEALRVGPVDAGQEADLAVRSTLGGLLGQLPWRFRRDHAHAGRQGAVSGDAELARRLQTLAAVSIPTGSSPS
jgi:ubiquinone biosynthesis protein UbiJ